MYVVENVEMIIQGSYNWCLCPSWGISIYNIFFLQVMDRGEIWWLHERGSAFKELVDAHHEAMGEAISSNQVASDAAIPPMAKSFLGRQSSWASDPGHATNSARRTGDWGLRHTDLQGLCTNIKRVVDVCWNDCSGIYSRYSPSGNYWCQTMHKVENMFNFFVVIWSICRSLQIKAKQVECWRLNKFHIGCATRPFLVWKMQVSWQNSILE